LCRFTSRRRRCLARLREQIQNLRAQAGVAVLEHYEARLRFRLKDPLDTP
jgi:hypothetical protein